MMNIQKVARYGVTALALLAASCTAQTAPQSTTGSDDNGADCGGTPQNKKNCINNQNGMGDPAP
jgi:hypothetical protein